jgi:hypothetical protein
MDFQSALVQAPSGSSALEIDTFLKHLLINPSIYFKIPLLGLAGDLALLVEKKHETASMRL